MIASFLFFRVILFVVIGHNRPGPPPCDNPSTVCKNLFRILSASLLWVKILLGALLSLSVLSVALAAALVIDCSSAVRHFGT